MSRRAEGVLLVKRWEVPYELRNEPLTGGKHDARILTMPMIARPLHGHGMQPRTIVGASTWNHMRKRCYFLAEYHCEACGKDLRRGECQAHELFDTNWEEGYARFVRCVCLCKVCHLQSIHVGRMLTLYKQGNPLMPKRKVMEGAENLFKNVHEYNKAHPKELIRAYAGILDALKIDSVKDEVAELLAKYPVPFYAENEKKMAKWDKWRVIIGDKEYPTPYKSPKEWRKAMDAAEENDSDRKASNPFSAPVYDELKKLIEK